MAQENINFLGEKVAPFNARLFLQKYLRYWYLIVLSMVIAGFAAYAYLYITPPTYQVSAVMMLAKEAKSTSDEILMESERKKESVDKVTEDEIEVLRSRKAMQQVVDDLNLSVGYFNIEKYGKAIDLYESSPIRLYAKKVTPLAFQHPFSVKVLDQKTYEFQDEEGQSKGVYHFNENISNDYGSFQVLLNDSLAKSSKPVKIMIQDREALAQYYQSAIEVFPISEKGNSLKITMEEVVPERGKAVLSKLMNIYTYSALAERNRQTDNALKFIDERLRLITGQLSRVENDVQQYRTNEGITDLSQQGTLFLGSVKSNDDKLNEIDLQLKMLDGIEGYLKTNESDIDLTTLSVKDPLLISLVSELGRLQIQQEKYSHTMQKDNPYLKTVQAQVANTQKAIRDNILSQRRNLVISRNSLAQLNTKLESSIKTIPVKERQFVNIKRQQEIKESLYLLLLQKKEELAIAFASTSTEGRIVDEPFSSPWPVKPSRMNIYLAAMLAGLLIPVGLISVFGMFNDKVQTRTDIENELGVTVFGEIMHRPKSAKKNTFDLQEFSVVSEQFRILRANLQYVLGKSEHGLGRTLLVTSSLANEGKSFVSINLASSLALLDKKVILLELDLRQPKVATYMGMASSNQTGVSDYLMDHEIELDDIIQQSPFNPNLYLISSGTIPSNPSELLAGKKMELLLEILRTQFDFVIIDTPPVMILADALTLAPHVDLALYLVRHNHTSRNSLVQLGRLHNSKKFKSLNVIFNDVDQRNAKEYGYGSYYSNANKR